MSRWTPGIGPRPGRVRRARRVRRDAARTHRTRSLGISRHRRRGNRPRPLRACRARRAVVPEAGPAPGGAHVLSPPLEELDEREPGSPRTRAARRVRWSRSRVHRRRRVLAVIGAVLAALLIWLAVSHRRRAHQPRPRKLRRLPAGRVVPRARRRVHRQLGRERVVLPPSAQGGRRAPARHHSQAEDRHHRRRSRPPWPHLPPPAADRPVGQPARRGRGAVVAGRPSRRRRARGVRDAASGPARSTRASWWGWRGWTRCSSRRRCTRAVRSPAVDPSRTPRPYRPPTPPPWWPHSTPAF